MAYVSCASPPTNPLIDDGSFEIRRTSFVVCADTLLANDRIINAKVNEFALVRVDGTLHMRVT
jgi:hypothetical protein